MLVACCDQNLRDLDVALLEHDLALLVADDRRAQLPLDLVERIDALAREDSAGIRGRPGTSRARLFRLVSSARPWPVAFVSWQPLSASIHPPHETALPHAPVRGAPNLKNLI